MPSVLIRAPRRHRKHFVPKTLVRGAISGVAAITFGDGNSTLAATGALAGAAALAFTNTGLIVSTSPLAGSAALAFTATPDLSMNSFLVGSAALTFTGLGTRSVIASIAGTSTLTFGADAELASNTVPFIENVVRIRR